MENEIYSSNKYSNKKFPFSQLCLYNKKAQKTGGIPSKNSNQHKKFLLDTREMDGIAGVECTKTLLSAEISFKKLTIKDEKIRV